MFAPEILILVVDDMAPMRAMVKGLLRDLKYKNLLEAANGKEAFSVIEKQFADGNPVQLVLSDWNMPVMTGLELLQKVRSTADLKDLPFMLITAEGEKTQILEAIKARVSDYLCKPLTPKNFQDKMLNVWKKTQ